MTNKDGDKNQPYDPRVATVLAVHLVRQVLDEAYIIANAAQDSGEPWRYVSGLRKLKRCSLNETYDEDTNILPLFGVPRKSNETKLNKTPNKVVTSTPQKFSCTTGSPNDHSLIGQGDEELIGDTDESKSTSMFITNLIDMSDVERGISFNDPDLIREKPETSSLVMIAMKKIMDSFVDSALNSAFEREILDTERKDTLDVTVTSSYSFLDDAISEDDYEVSTLNFKIDDQLNGTYSKQVPDHNATSTQHDLACYEKAFLTLNRDFEQYSEEDDDPVLQDPKGLCLQEIELLTGGSSGDIMFPANEMKKKEFAAVSGVSSSGLGSKKSSIVRRCRIQGARLLACFRGWWWRRKIPEKRREVRNSGSIRGICPLSPDARRRAASLLDQRQLSTPSPSKSVIWKFNTVNEALVHSSQWKEFTSNIT